MKPRFQTAFHRRLHGAAEAGGAQDVAARHFGVAREVGDGAGGAQDAVEAAGGEGEFFQQRAQGFFGFGGDVGGFVDFGGG